MTALRAITRPTGLSVETWTSAIAVDLSQFGVVGSLQGPDWQQWGLQLLNNPAIDATLPDPYQFADWNDWANRVCDELS